MTPSVCTMAGGVLIYCTLQQYFFIGEGKPHPLLYKAYSVSTPSDYTKNRRVALFLGGCLRILNFSLCGLTSVKSEKNDTPLVFS